MINDTLDRLKGCEVLGCVLNNYRELGGQLVSLSGGYGAYHYGSHYARTSGSGSRREADR